MRPYNNRAISIAKLYEETVCEDASFASPVLVAVSDGAGGGGLFADKWSHYLVKHVPEKPIDSFESFDLWVGSIWEPFYNYCEQEAQLLGGMYLRKFYEEGAFATIAISWLVGKKAFWITYGDSIVFHYAPSRDKLEWSKMKLASFNDPPFLVGTSTPLSFEGFHKGSFSLEPGSVVFVASDALSHYIMMMYELQHRDSFAAELNEDISSQSKNSSFIKAASMVHVRRTSKWLMKLIRSSRNKANFHRHIDALIRRGYIAKDDYSFAYLFASPADGV